MGIGNFLADPDQPSDHLDDEPIRAELLGIEQLKDLARKLAATHRVSSVPEHGRDLLGRLEDNQRKLEEAYSILAEVTPGEHRSSPAAEWLADNLLRLSNTTDRPRRLSVTTYHELVLGAQREQSAPFIITAIDKESGAVIARNHCSADVGNLLGFAAVSGEPCTVTADRREFLGPGGSLNRPAAMNRTGLSGSTGAGLDPCIAIQTVFELAPHQTTAKVVLLGQARSLEEVRATVSRFSSIDNAEAALEQINDYWQDVLGAIQIHTPDPALDLLMNRWLLYQVLSCRVYARASFYQSGGAYGFRDQLQDVMALVYAKPDVAREHILRAAGQQFKEGDVQHWWHPPHGRGLRTRVSDDAIWLPYASSFYVDVTGDLSIFDEEVPFIEGPALAGEKETYAQPSQSTDAATLFEHCVRALERSLATGAHGLPLMGTGDWNDGMDKVGPGGRGESIWLGWFLITVLRSFQRLSDQRGRIEQGARFRRHADRLRDALEGHGWDGGWYRRAYFDDGTPLGSSQNGECRIDSMSQSWAVISEAADRQRAALAMDAVDDQLVRRGDGIVLLLTPPFNTSAMEPGYIKAYVPGVRENGGQYSHAAMWALIAFAMLRDGDRAGELLSLLNPIGHASTRAASQRYQVEPYVVAGDVYSVAPHVGRGGWTWYTGAAAWMYRAALESVLGFRLQGNNLRIEPCIPRSWRKYEIMYRNGTASYQIEVHNPQGVCSGVSEVELDGEPKGASEITLLDDGRSHRLRVVLGSSSAGGRILSAPGRERAVKPG